MLAESRLEERMRQLSRLVGDGRVYHLYGDPAYAEGPYMMRGYKGPLTAQQAYLTHAMNALRVSVEHGFALIVRDWRFLDCDCNLKIWKQPIALMYSVAAIMTNTKTCLMALEHDGRGIQISSRFHMSPPSLHYYLHG